MQWIQQSKRHLAGFYRRGIDLLYPPQCACCNTELEESEQVVGLCGKCQKRLIPQVWNACPCCGALVEGNNAPHNMGCSTCAKNPLHFDSVTSLGSYHSELKQIILRMKRHSSEPLAVTMGYVLAIQRRDMLKNWLPDLVIPIPMHWTQRIFRGVNSPEFVARALGKTLEIPFRRWVLIKCKKTRTQSELPPKQRFSNVRGAFRVRFARQIQGRRVLLVDDVLTTGATCSEAAKVLKQAGAAMVAVAVVARTHEENR